MKILAWIGGIVVALVVAIYVVLFTGFGNSLIKPSIEKYVSSKVGMDFAFEKFSLGLGNFDIIATLNKELSLSSNGKFSILTRQFDLNYSTQAKSFNGMDVDLALAGDAMGSFNNFVANGKGTLAGSNIDFNGRIKDYAPLELRLDAKELDLKALSLIALKKPYLGGKLTATANIVGEEGSAKITAPTITIDESAQKDFNITLPKNFSLALNSDIKSISNKISAISTIKSPIATAGAKNTSYDFAKSELTSDFELDIADLAKLEPIIKQKLKGSIKVAGNTQIIGAEMKFLDAKIIGLGGEVLAKLEKNELNADIKSIKLAQVLGLLGSPMIANAGINGKANIKNVSDIANLSGNADLKLEKGVLYHKEMNALTGADLSADVPFEAQNLLKINSGILDFNSVLTSPVVQKLNATGNYNLSNSDAKADINAQIDNLGAIFGSAVKGGANAKINAQLKNSTLSAADVDIKGLGGSITAKVKGKGLEAKINNIEAGSLFAFAAMERLLNGTINGQISLDSLNLQNLNGKGQISVTNGVFNSAAMSKLLGSHFPENTKFSLNFKPTFTNSVAYFTSNFASDIAQIDKFDGSYNLSKAHLDANYILNVKDLSKLAFVTGVALHTPLNVNGKIITDNNIIKATANSDIFSSNTNITFAQNTLNLDMKKAKIEQILKALGYDQFYLGDADAKLNYSLTSASGAFEADILRAHLAKTGFTNALSLVLGGRDITTEVYENGIVKGTIKNDIIAFNANLHSKRSDINATSATINTKSKALKIPLRANYEKTDIAVDITGTTDAPKYNVSSDYLKQKAKEGVGKLLNKALGGDETSTTTQEKKGGAKELIKGLKGLF